jgi:PAS domain S-box-containing protein
MQQGESAVVVRSVKGVIIGWDAAAENLFGYRAYEALGRPTDLFLSDFAASLDEPEFFEDEAPAVTVCITKQGHALSVRRRRTPIRDAAGNLHAVCELIAPVERLPDALQTIAARAADEHYLKRELYEHAKSSGSVLEFLQTSCLDGLFYWNLIDTEDIWLSPRLKQVLGYEDHELPSCYASLAQTLNLEDGARLRAALERHLAEPGSTFDEFARYLHKDGSTVWIRCRGMALRDASGRPFRMLGAHVNVSALKRSEERFRALFESAQEAHFSFDRELGTIEACSRRLCRSTEWLEADLIGRPLSTLLDAADLQALLATVDGKDTVDAVDLTLRARGERKVCVLARITRPHDGSTRLVRVECLEPCPLASEDELTSVLEYLPQSVLVVAEDGRVAALNAAASALFGFARDELVGQPLARVYPVAELALLARMFARAREVPSAKYEDWLALTALGAKLPTQVAVRTITLHGKSFMLMTSIDVSAQAATRQALRESEAHFRQLAESLPQLTWTCSPDGATEFLNRRWLEFTGVPEPEQLGFGWLRVLHPEDSARVLELWKRCVESNADEYACEFRIRRYDGVYRWFDTRAVPLRNDSGRVVRWVGSNTDINEARELREKLRAEQEHLAQIVAGSPGVVVSYRIHPDGFHHFDFVSSAVHELYGFTPSEMRDDADRPWTCVPIEEAERLRQLLDESGRSGMPITSEYRYVHPTRGLRWHEVRALPTRGVGGEVTWNGVVVDVTARKQIDEKLALVQSQLESACSAAEMGAWVWNAEHNTMWGSETQRRIWNVPASKPEWFDARLITAQMSVEDSDMLAERTARAFSDGARLEAEFRLNNPDGTFRWLSSRALAERHPDGRPRRLVGINLDITRQKLAAEATLRSQKLEGLGTLAGGIAHDFNNVLFAISGNTALAQNMVPEGSRLRSLLDEVASASARAAELVRQILAFSQPEQQKSEVIPVMEPVREALRLVRATVPAMVEITSELAPDAPCVLAERSRLVQVVVNLCTNAAHAIGKARRGHIDVRLQQVSVRSESEAEVLHVPQGRYAVLTVRDDGAGMEQATLARIFDPFFTTKPQGEGSGLGLSVVHGIVKALGGSIAVDTQIGKGSTFRVYLPAVQRAAVPPVQTPVHVPPGAGKRILLVDDEELLVVLGSTFLELLGYQPAGFQQAPAALSAFRDDPDSYAAVITDLSMPNMSGFELARSLLAIRKDLPILMMSGFLGPEERAMAQRVGIRELVLKPISLEKLGELLGKLC